jgi:D-alanyl-D-alanine dipeptidase
MGKRGGFVSGAVAALLILSGGSAHSGLYAKEFFAALIQGARMRGYDVNSIPLKPNPREPRAFCTKASTCAPFCEGTKPLEAKALAAYQRAGNDVPEMVDPAVAVQTELTRLGCLPAGGSDSRKASSNCGIRFMMPTRGVLPGVVRGLARAALEAGARGYVLVIGSSFRPVRKQLENVCENVAKGLGKVCGSTIACPGGSKHGSGYAVDAGLELGEKLVTRMTGTARSCAANREKIEANPHLRALNDVMFAAGWWRYCRELWHFEYSLQPADASRIQKY